MVDTEMLAKIILVLVVIVVLIFLAYLFLSTPTKYEEGETLASNLCRLWGAC